MELLPDEAAAYRLEHRGKLMVLAKLRNAVPAADEFCRILRVETLSPGLWVSAAFPDGSVKNFRPEKIRQATAEEQQIAGEF